MLDWLKFFPFAKAQYKRPLVNEVRGPYFPKLRKNTWCLGDSTFYFNAPWANPILGFDGCGRRVNAKRPSLRNILTTDWERIYGGSDAPPSLWDMDLFYSKSWFFTGPWFTGEQARLIASGVLVSAEKGSRFTESNLFHPRVFESAIANYLDGSYGYRRSGKKPDFRGPLNWHIKELSSGIQAVVCDIHFIANGGKDNPDLYRSVFFPVSPQQFIRINFDFVGVLSQNDEIRCKPLMALCDAIIDSMRLEVGESIQMEWDKVKATCPDMSITETFGELSWPLIKEKASKKKKEADITPNEAPKALQG